MLFSMPVLLYISPVFLIAVAKLALELNLFGCGVARGLQEPVPAILLGRKTLEDLLGHIVSLLEFLKALLYRIQI